MQDYSNRYSESSFWAKCKKAAKRVGKEGMEKALWLYYAMKKEDCPLWARAAILSALGYFVFPVDAVPDFIPVAGYADDVGVLGAALATVASEIDGGVKGKTSDKLAEWGMS